MALQEIIIIVACLFIGYWGVSKLIAPKTKDEQVNANSSKPPPNEDVR